eukprot:5970735-Prymnesium_polylepis.1
MTERTRLASAPATRRKSGCRRRRRRARGPRDAARCPGAAAAPSLAACCARPCAPRAGRATRMGRGASTCLRAPRLGTAVPLGPCGRREQCLRVPELTLPSR